MTTVQKRLKPTPISKRGLLARAMDVTGCGRILRATGAWEGVLILNYHRVGNWLDSPLDRNLWSASDEDFDAQIEMISRNFEVIGLNDLDAALTSRRGRHVMVTFDDGYRDNYTNAYPVLKSHGVPATFFITTGFLDIPMIPWWDEIAWIVRSSVKAGLDINPWTTTAVRFDEPDREAAINRLLAVYKRLRGTATYEYISFLAESLQTGRCPQQISHELWMTWDMIREMSQNGMSIGGHTVNHPVLANLTADEQDYEVRECRRRLIEELDEPIDAFSYPVGGPTSFNADSRAVVIRNGFKMVFTYLGGYCHHGHYDRFEIPRTAVETDIDLSHFRAVTTLPQIFA